MSEPDDEHLARVKRGAFPTPRSKIERAEPFVPDPPESDGDGSDAATPDADDARAASSSGSGSTTEP